MPEPFDIDFKFLPPELQIKLWLLALDADTSKVNLAFKEGAFTTSLAYNYGGNIEASVAIRRFTSTVSVDPSHGAVDLGLAYRGFKFSASAAPSGNYGVGIGYGAKLLPFPDDMSKTFTSGAAGLQTMAGSLGSGFSNPLDWYNLHSNDVKTITSAVSLGQDIAKQKSGLDSFGASFRLAHTDGHLTVYLGAGVNF